MENNNTKILMIIKEKMKIITGIGGNKRQNGWNIISGKLC